MKCVLKISCLLSSLKIQSGKKSYKCNQCTHASLRSVDLRRHLKTHYGDKSYICDQCDYASVQAFNLRTHLKIHSGDKSYKCNQCEYASIQASNLKKTFENSLWRHMTQMQPMWICICWGECYEGKFENSLWTQKRATSLLHTFHIWIHARLFKTQMLP